jgi:hypothetical protein
MPTNVQYAHLGRLGEASRLLIRTQADPSSAFGQAIKFLAKL